MCGNGFLHSHSLPFPFPFPCSGPRHEFTSNFCKKNESDENCNLPELCIIRSCSVLLMLLHYRVDARIQFTVFSFCTLLCKKNRLSIESGRGWFAAFRESGLRCWRPARWQMMRLAHTRCGRRLWRVVAARHDFPSRSSSCQRPFPPSCSHSRPVHFFGAQCRTDQNCDGLTKSRNAQTSLRQVRV